MEIPNTLIVPVKSQPELEKASEFFSVEEWEEEPVSVQSKKKQLDYCKNFENLLTGVLPKKTQNLVWQDRYFCLTPNRLIYYSSQSEEELKGCFNFVSLQKFQPQLKEEQNVLTYLYELLRLLARIPGDLRGEMRELIKLNFEDNRQNLLKWKNALMSAINLNSYVDPQIYPQISQVSFLNPQSKINGFNFWNKIFISVNEFQSYANHMDIIFFRSRKPAACFHRLMMRSHFDHVGLLFKDELNRVFILEAIQSRGVWVNDWNELLPSLQQVYEEIAFKKLILGKDQKLDFEQIQKELNSVLGKKYELSLTKLLVSEQEEEINKSSMKQIQNQREAKKNQNENNFNFENALKEKDENVEGKKRKSEKQITYFCSELIGDLYIKLGLIQGKKKHEFWPMDFEGNLRLEGGAYLSPLMDIQL